MEEMTERAVRSFELEDHGIDHAQYFLGAGLAFSDFEDIRTGAGSTPREALDDALEQLACSGWSFDEETERAILAELSDPDSERLAELERESEEEALPALSFRVAFYASSGCSPSPESFDEESEARERVAELLRSRRAGGSMVSVLERGARWETRDPDDAFIEDGTLELSSNEDEREEERDRIRDRVSSELYCYVSVRVSSEE